MPFTLLAAAVAAAALTAVRSRRRRRAYPELAARLEPAKGLPPISESEALAVMAEAERAAIEQALGGTPKPNPHAYGTRARILWEAHHGATLLEWES